MPMRFDKLTIKSQEALTEAQSLATARGHSLIEPAHLLYALLRQPEGSTIPVLQKLGVMLEPLQRAIEGPARTRVVRASTTVSSSPKWGWTRPSRARRAMHRASRARVEVRRDRSRRRKGGMLALRVTGSFPLYPGAGRA